MTSRHRFKVPKVSNKAGPSHHSQMEEDLSPVEGYEHVAFESSQQRIRFLELLGRRIEPTRFLSPGTLTTLGIRQEFYDLLMGTGCHGLIDIVEPTYRCLTLEFLSSFSYNQRSGMIHFRLYNDTTDINLETWGSFVGARSTGEVKTSTPRDGSGILWRALTGLPYGEGNFKFRAHLIHHPVIRLWCRLVGITYFARSEPTNLTARETQILFAHLNIDHGVRFEVNVAHWVARHFEAVAKGTIKEIHMGGFVTHIAKLLYDVDEEDLIPLDFDPNPPLMDIGYLDSLHYLQIVNPLGRSKTYWWRLGRDFIATLPDRDEVGYVKPILSLPTRPNTPVNMGYYLLPSIDTTTPDVTQSRGPRSTHERGETSATPVDPPTFRGNFRSPDGDYSRFQHYPFHLPPYPTDYYDPSLYAPSFVPPPPFAYPETWTQDSRDSMLYGLCNAIQQVNFDRSLGDHNIYDYHYRAGHFPEGTRHPGYFVPSPLDESSAGVGGSGGTGVGGHGVGRTGVGRSDDADDSDDDGDRFADDQDGGSP